MKTRKAKQDKDHLTVVFVIIIMYVHPQAILQMADQAARIPFLSKELDFHCGFILGTNEGPHIELTAALQASVTKQPDGSIKINSEVKNSMIRMHKEIYKNEIPIGWYTVQRYDKEDIEKLRTVFESNIEGEDIIRGEFIYENDPPLALYISKGEKWIQTEYTYEAELAERIAMMQLQAEGNAENQVAFTADAFKSLDEHLALIEQYLNKVINGEAPFIPDLVRKCANVAQWWSRSDSEEEYKNDIEMDEAKLSLLITMLAESVSLYQANSQILPEYE